MDNKMTGESGAGTHRENLEELKRVIKLGLENHKSDRHFNDHSFIDGFQWFAECFAVWRDGDRHFGNRGMTTRQLTQAVMELYDEAGFDFT